MAIVKSNLYNKVYGFLKDKSFGLSFFCKKSIPSNAVLQIHFEEFKYAQNKFKRVLNGPKYIRRTIKLTNFDFIFRNFICTFEKKEEVWQKYLL